MKKVKDAWEAIKHVPEEVQRYTSLARSAALPVQGPPEAVDVPCKPCFTGLWGSSKDRALLLDPVGLAQHATSKHGADTCGGRLDDTVRVPLEVPRRCSKVQEQSVKSEETRVKVRERRAQSEELRAKGVK